MTSPSRADPEPAESRHVDADEPAPIEMGHAYPHACEGSACTPTASAPAAGRPDLLERGLGVLSEAVCNTRSIRVKVTTTRMTSKSERYDS
jgi:hypothetical protein